MCTGKWEAEGCGKSTLWAMCGRNEKKNSNLKIATQTTKIDIININAGLIYHRPVLSFYTLYFVLSSFSGWKKNTHTHWRTSHHTSEKEANQKGIRIATSNSNSNRKKWFSKRKRKHNYEFILHIMRCIWLAKQQYDIISDEYA